MSEIIFATNNDQKVLAARKSCKKYNIELAYDDSLNIPEIQSDNSQEIARHKANEAFRLLNKPVIITDDTWNIPALGGFPGPYAKAMNQWLSTDDWLRLTRELADRRIFLNQILVYQDALEQVLFEQPIEGILLAEPQGVSALSGEPLISFDGGEHSIADLRATGASAIVGRKNAWDAFGAWFTSRAS